ncbi:hypothetical protein [Streptomyces sp. NPDC003247]|uniref:nSTAND1 domain-containing NTPase n=1 Tax=Streptomyces sp. NPDC003247 TaxID=3364677 RepID=UPI0036CDF0F3
MAQVHPGGRPRPGRAPPRPADPGRGIGRPLSVLLVMRDDFYPRLAAWAPELLAAVEGGPLNVPATLGQDDLRDIIVRPVRDAGARYADGLPERIIADVLAADTVRGRADRSPSPC